MTLCCFLKPDWIGDKIPLAGHFISIYLKYTNLQIALLLLTFVCSPPPFKRVKHFIPGMTLDKNI